jgi:hypothetical protein
LLWILDDTQHKLPCLFSVCRRFASEKINSKNNVALAGKPVCRCPNIVIKAPPFVDNDDCRQRIDHISRKDKVSVHQLFIHLGIRQTLRNNGAPWRYFCGRARVDRTVSVLCAHLVDIAVTGLVAGIPGIRTSGIASCDKQRQTGQPGQKTASDRFVLEHRTILHIVRTTKKPLVVMD